MPGVRALTQTISPETMRPRDAHAAAAASAVANVTKQYDPFGVTCSIAPNWENASIYSCGSYVTHGETCTVVASVVGVVVGSLSGLERSIDDDRGGVSSSRRAVAVAVAAAVGVAAVGAAAGSKAGAGARAAGGGAAVDADAASAAILPPAERRAATTSTSESRSTASSDASSSASPRSTEHSINELKTLNAAHAAAAIPPLHSLFLNFILCAFSSHIC